ncbi:MAG TPA: NAD(P)/FAD-dependent oxidoreductase [Mycobacteriales bacterium]|nr:NAD(P)/FAD-dependent oxidoreductase [Mycobacteriales bacterium]
MPTEHVDLLIVGAGLSGVGAAHQFQERFPGRSYLILEAREDLGGTWSLFRYPGIRSDSDMHTLGYRFRPWVDGKAIADGPAILDYVRETARAGGVDRRIRYGRRVISADWSSATATWTVVAEDAGTGERSERSELSCGFLFVCSGYFRYDEGYLPDFPGRQCFSGPFVHPQQWPPDLDYAGKRVVVIGSGATAVTMVPALAETAAHVTMLQRSPSYIVNLPSVDRLAERLSRLLPERVAYSLVRWRNIARMMLSYQVSQRAPRLMRAIIRQAAQKQLPPDFDHDTHLSPRYKPWDQRLCVTPDGDLFKAVRGGRVSIVTDEIETFTPTGVQLASGSRLDADIVVAATGLNLLALGGIALFVDGRPVELPKTMSYKAIMLSDVPNLAFALGYTNASWTLKVDLTYSYVWRLMRHMARTGTRWCAPRRRDGSVSERPFMEFSPGYVTRSIDSFPRSGSRSPWRLRMNYLFDVIMLSCGRVDDGTMEFGTPGEPSARAEPARIAS